MEYRMRTLRRLLFLALMLAAVFAATAQAETVSNVPYVIRQWMEPVVVSMDYMASNCTVIDEDTEKISSDWYVVNGNVYSEKRLVVDGTANIILCDGARLFLEEGIPIMPSRSCSGAPPMRTSLP